MYSRGSAPTLGVSSTRQCCARSAAASLGPRVITVRLRAIVPSVGDQLPGTALNSHRRRKKRHADRLKADQVNVCSYRIADPFTNTPSAGSAVSVNVRCAQSIAVGAFGVPPVALLVVRATPPEPISSTACEGRTPFQVSHGCRYHGSLTRQKVTTCF